MSPELLAKLINACRTGNPKVTLGRKVVKCAEDSLQIIGGLPGILKLIGTMTLGDFTPALTAERIFQMHPLKPSLENYHFYYLGTKSFLSFFSERERDAAGKIRILDGFIIKSFHSDGYFCNQV